MPVTLIDFLFSEHHNNTQGFDLGTATQTLQQRQTTVHVNYRSVTSGDSWKEACFRSLYDWWSCWWWAVVLYVSWERWNSIVLMRGFLLCHFELESYTGTRESIWDICACFNKCWHYSCCCAVKWIGEIIPALFFVSHSFMYSTVRVMVYAPREPWTFGMCIYQNG